MAQSSFVARMPEIRDNLTMLYRRSSTNADIAQGTAWYPSVHRIVCEWSDTYGYSIATVASCIALISPQCQWERNLIIADDLLAGRLPSIGGAFKSSVTKAQRLLTDRASNTLDYMPQGPKVANFAANLAGDFSFVTVDTHTFQAALNDVETRITLRWNTYTIIHQCYAEAANHVGLEPAIFQAICWHTWKRLYPRIEKIRRRTQWYAMGEC